MQTVARGRMGAGGVLIAATLAMLVSPAVCAEPRQAHYVLGVFPYLPPVRLERLYAPVARALGEAAGVHLTFRTRGSFERFREALAEGRFDLVFVQPFDYVRAAAPAGYRPLARWKGRLRALVVTRAEGAPVESIADLGGRRVAMPPPDAAVSILGRALLAERGLAGAVEIAHLRNHFACIRQVLAHTAAACVTARSPLRVYRARFGGGLRVIARSRPIPSSLFAAHARVPGGIARKWRAALLSWHESEAGRRLLRGLGFDAFVPANDGEYDVVRAIWRELAGHGEI